MSAKNKLQSRSIQDLYRALLKLKTRGEYAKFLRDLCTREEINEMSKRWRAVLMLDRKKPYREIAKKTGLSTATVTRVAEWMNNGTGGYRLALKRLRK